MLGKKTLQGWIIDPTTIISHFITFLKYLEFLCASNFHGDYVIENRINRFFENQHILEHAV